MTQLGKNQKWIVRPAHREALHAVFAALGAKKVPNAPIDVFTLVDGALIGVEIDADALDEAAARKGAWLEFVVDDPDATARALEALALKRLEYHDQEHAYFQAPGGPVFRLARA